MSCMINGFIGVSLQLEYFLHKSLHCYLVLKNDVSREILTFLAKLYRKYVIILNLFKDLKKKST